MGLTLVAAPAIEPVTIADVKAHLRIETSLGELAPGAPTAALAGAGTGNIDNGAHRYLVTFVTADGETDSGAISSAVTVADKTVNGQISLTGIQIGGSNVTARKIYRTLAGGSSYLLLATISDNSTTVFTDNVTDANLGAGAPTVNTTTDPYLNGLITAARLTCEDFTKRKFITQTWNQTLDCWPMGYVIKLMLPPIQSIGSISYQDQNDVTQTLDPTTYHTSLTKERARICLNNNSWWPTLRTIRLDPVTIPIVTGYGLTAASVPAPIRQAMLMLIAHWYNQREDIIAGMMAMVVPKAADYLLAPYVSWEF